MSPYDPALKYEKIETSSAAAVTNVSASQTRTETPFGTAFAQTKKTW